MRGHVPSCCHAVDDIAVISAAVDGGCPSYPKSMGMGSEIVMSPRRTAAPALKCARKVLEERCLLFGEGIILEKDRSSQATQGKDYWRKQDNISIGAREKIWREITSSTTVSRDVKNVSGVWASCHVLSLSMLRPKSVVWFSATAASPVRSSNRQPCKVDIKLL